MAFFVRYRNRRRALAANVGHRRVFLGSRGEAASALDMKVKAGMIALGGPTWRYISSLHGVTYHLCMEWAIFSF